VFPTFGRFLLLGLPSGKIRGHDAHSLNDRAVG
jgi:hypothetical protein